MYKYLEKQLKNEKCKVDAENCIKIYNKLKELNGGGSVWASQISTLFDVKFQGFPSDERTYKPSRVGCIFLKGISD